MYIIACFAVGFLIGCIYKYAKNKAHAARWGREYWQSYGEKRSVR